MKNDYLDPRWQKKRLEILERDEWSCRKCKDNTSTLHVHHRYYQKEFKPWEYFNSSLITLCDKCHKHETDHLEHYAELLKKAVCETFFSDDIITIAEGLRDHKLNCKSEIAAGVIEFALKNQEICEAITELFYEDQNIRIKEMMCLKESAIYNGR